MKSRPEGRRKLLGGRRAAGYDARMSGQDFAQVVSAVLAANFLTVFAVQTLRMSDSDDLPWSVIFRGIGAGGAFIVIGLAALGY